MFHNPTQNTLHTRMGAEATRKLYYNFAVTTLESAYRMRIIPPIFGMF